VPPAPGRGPGLNIPAPDLDTALATAGALLAPDCGDQR
jgi:hypothetical protein